MGEWGSAETCCSLWKGEHISTRKALSLLSVFSVLMLLCPLVVAAALILFPHEVLTVLSFTALPSNGGEHKTVGLCGAVESVLFIGARIWFAFQFGPTTCPQCCPCQGSIKILEVCEGHDCEYESPACRAAWTPVKLPLQHPDFWSRGTSLEI